MVRQAQVYEGCGGVASSSKHGDDSEIRDGKSPSFVGPAARSYKLQAMLRSLAEFKALRAKLRLYLEQLKQLGLERIRTDSMGSTISTDSEQEVDIEGMEFTPGEADSVTSVSDGEDHYSLQGSSSDGSYIHSHRLQPVLC
ncbi:hypothetical protein JZ751_012629 [Albula glossodonta]|uniref:Uncharacterized protein n=1 Tax=Albula glossodonta TaxID=121402 RepID=A0A8T2P664_9TELE|nr:hypothetical protein JZ751_012629 [Albula glossodonta]